MNRTIEVEIDDCGVVHPKQATVKLPVGRGFLTWTSIEEASPWILSERSFAEDWSRPEEDAAWAYLQPDK